MAFLGIDFSIITNNLPFFWQGVLITIIVSLLGIGLGFILGVIFGLSRISRSLPVRWIATAYVEVIRGTPLLVQIFIIFFGLPSIGIRLTEITAGVLALGINSGAYQAEIIRGGIQAVPNSQMEAARSIGMTRLQAMRYVILPQGFRHMIPPMTNEFVTIIKDSSLVSAIAVAELTYKAQQLNARYFEPFLIFIFIAILYFILTFTTSKLMRMAERKFAIPGYGEEG